jgi:hypothetical protein
MDQREGLVDEGWKNREEMVKDRWLKSFRRKEVPVGELVEMIRSTKNGPMAQKVKMPSLIEKVPCVKDYIRLNLTEGACQ